MLESAEFSQQVNDLGAILTIQRRPSELMLMNAYVLFASQDLVPTVWHAGIVQPSAILESAKGAGTIYYACLVQRGGERLLAGLGWAHDAQEIEPGKFTGTVGMAFLREFQTHEITTEFCEMMLDDAFYNLGFVSLYGFTPMDNRSARLFQRAMKFSVIGTLPSYSTWQGRACDIQLSVMTAESWLGRSSVAEPQTEEAMV